MDKLALFVIGVIFVWWVYGRFRILQDEAERRTLRAYTEFLERLQKAAEKDAHEAQKALDSYNDLVERESDTLGKYGIRAKPIPSGGPAPVIDPKG